MVSASHALSRSVHVSTPRHSRLSRTTPRALHMPSACCQQPRATTTLAVSALLSRRLSKFLEHIRMPLMTPPPPPPRGRRRHRRQVSMRDRVSTATGSSGAA